MYMTLFSLSLYLSLFIILNSPYLPTLIFFVIIILLFYLLLFLISIAISARKDECF